MSASDTADAGESAIPAGRTVLMVHGGGFKPTRNALASIWREALAVGLDRDFEEAGGRTLLEKARLEFVYYADLLNPLHVQTGDAPDADLDLTDRRRDLERLAGLSGKKKFRRVHYESLPGKSAVREFVVDVSAPLLNALRLSDRALARRLPVLQAYLAPGSTLREGCEARVMEAVGAALARGDKVLLLSHAMGSVVCYDALWRLSHEPSTNPRGGRVDTWITFGSPLASDFIKSRLRGAKGAPEQRYPDKLVTWYNLAAEDDYYCHDKTMANDFSALLTNQRISRVKDYRIYNLSIRYGRSNPHSAAGYLVHPRMIELVANWLRSAAHQRAQQ